MIARRILLAALVALSALLVACDPLAGRPRQADMTRGPTLDRVTLHVRWVQRAELPPGKGGLTRGPELIDGDWHAYVTVVQPADFNDFEHTEILGHECFHALGARHKEN